MVTEPNFSKQNAKRRQPQNNRMMSRFGYHDRCRWPDIDARTLRQTPKVLRFYKNFKNMIFNLKTTLIVYQLLMNFDFFLFILVEFEWREAMKLCDSSTFVNLHCDVVVMLRSTKKQSRECVCSFYHNALAFDDLYQYQTRLNNTTKYRFTKTTNQQVKQKNHRLLDCRYLES
jgi:hypothetical protein